MRDAGFQALLVDDPGADLEVRAWRFCYNARGIIEMPNRLRADQTALIVVHPWGIDDGQGWRTPGPAGVADFCTLEKNHLAGRHTRDVINPLLKSLRGKAAFVMYSLPGKIVSGFSPDAIIEAFKTDKKQLAGKLHFILPTGIGSVEERHDLDLDLLRDVLGELQGG